MPRLFKNCGHLSKATACNLLYFPRLILSINLTKKVLWPAVEYKRVGIKNFQFLSTLIKLD